MLGADKAARALPGRGGMPGRVGASAAAGSHVERAAGRGSVEDCGVAGCAGTWEQTFWLVSFICLFRPWVRGLGVWVGGSELGSLWCNLPVPIVGL